LSYCRERGWAGHDPYDCLNGTLFARFPFLDARLPRLALTQLLKRSPVNLRPLLGVPRSQNPKGIALFLAAVTRLGQLGLIGGQSLVGELLGTLTRLRAPHARYWCWGYDFAWQTRTVCVPRGTPNLVATTFAANALLDVYQATGDRACLDIAASAATFLAQELFWTDRNGVAAFAYPFRESRVPVHNANLLGAALLCRVRRQSGLDHLLEPALAAARYSVGRQREDGSWLYGEAPAQAWVDNFHTGYNLCALARIGDDAETAEFEASVRRGFDFYRANFFREDGAPKYYADATYPIDIHSVAQSIVTLCALDHLHRDSVPLALSVYRWAMAHMWDPQGYFYYRVLRFLTVKIEYMRWGQAWMLVALAELLAVARSGLAHRGASHA
jgi:hypothetical protein